MTNTPAAPAPPPTSSKDDIEQEVIMEYETRQKEKLADAASKLKAMTPDDLVALTDELTDYKLAASIPEAPAIIYTHLLSEKGAEFVLTLRAPTGPEAVDAIARTIVYARDAYHMRPKTTPTPPWLDKPVVPAAPAYAPLAQEAPAGPPMAAQEQYIPDQQTVATPTSTEPKREYPPEFPASKISVEVKDGKKYFKVASANPKFPKFPVTVWPEVLQAAGIDDTKIPLEGCAMNGWTAHYEKNDKGFPSKVDRLFRTP